MPKFSKIHEAIRQLANLCDGAHARDGYGFNQRDSEFGHSMAAQTFPLTIKQAPHAMRMCNFYRRQLVEYGYDLAELQAEFWAGMALRLGVAVTESGGQYSAEVVTGFESLPKGIKPKLEPISACDKASAVNALVATLKAKNMTGSLFFVGVQR